MSADKNDNILREHFWFTATAVGVNGFLMTNPAKFDDWALRTVSTVVSLYAGYPIVERSASHVDKVVYPDDIERVPPRDRTFLHKTRETWSRFRIVPSHLLFIVCEFSGAFFYLLLVSMSCVGVWFRP